MMTCLLRLRTFLRAHWPPFVSRKTYLEICRIYRDSQVEIASLRIQRDRERLERLDLIERTASYSLEYGPALRLYRVHLQVTEFAAILMDIETRELWEMVARRLITAAAEKARLDKAYRNP